MAGTYSSSLVVNPGAETNTTGWGGSANTTLARVTTPVHSGSGAFRMTAIAAGSDQMLASAPITGLLAGQTVQAAVWVRTAVTARLVNIQVDWLTSANGFVSTTSNSLTDSTSYQHLIGTFTVPATATKGNLYCTVGSVVTSEIHYADDFTFQVLVQQMPFQPHLVSIARASVF